MKKEGGRSRMGEGKREEGGEIACKCSYKGIIKTQALYIYTRIY